MITMEPRANLYREMSDFISMAHAAAQRGVFSTIFVGTSYVVITSQASLNDTLEGCLQEMVRSYLEIPTQAQARGYARASWL